mmetsp:Transcript_34204/g.45217  ORF Transcript_34204/g.45217 Transcript_34204/m.45217 type:complete len:302 (-) Transcript_34204:334-1239(-)|eukprot:CAMPEP_0117750944 /NCGR_PEP_ID=MMETSP0947-20121206/10675_1 /TAXON_ID=44440 /ORGANISM="Chattonella subsalsa, Strain CCMP2191" /LENGTH=301 /DNA_ID=CAMNT_0005569219 /DNA_START=77 /DNA_END=982 /DNA_ORIENTATION=+
MKGSSSFLKVFLVCIFVQAVCAFISSQNNQILSKGFFANPSPSIYTQVSQKRYGVANLQLNGDIEWRQVKVIQNVEAAQGSKSILIEPSADVSGSYTNPGQYVQMKKGDSKPGFYAIASAPGKGENGAFEFLIKEAESNSWLTNAKPGDVVDMSAAMGKGFQIEENFEGFKYDFPTQYVFMFAAGSGIAPIRAAIESDVLKLPAGRTATLYYGARCASTMAYKEKFEQWQESGVNVIPVLSQPEAGWTGRTGYVQDALKEDLVPAPRNCGVLLCGMKGMVDDVKYVFTTAGTFEGRQLTNF